MLTIYIVYIYCFLQYMYAFKEFRINLDNQKIEQI